MNPDPAANRHETSAQAAESPAGEHAYPSELAALVLTRWHEATAAGLINLPAPAISTLARVLSICYQATLLREEGRPVTFRLALGEPEAFDPAAGFSRSLIGATLSGAGQEIWGVIHSGTQWLQSVRGGRETEQTIPPVL